MRLGGEGKHHHPALARVATLKSHCVVVVSKESALVALKDGEEAFLIFTLSVGIVHGEVGNNINGNV